MSSTKTRSRSAARPRPRITPFGIGKDRKFFVEAKKPSVKIKDDAEAAYQLRRYAWSKKLPLSILTNFREVAVYDGRTKPNQTDKASVARVRDPDARECPQWDEIAGDLCERRLLKGSFDKFAESPRGKAGRRRGCCVPQRIEGWRADLAKNLALRNPKLRQRDLNYAVQRTIDRIVFLRICEDRGIEVYGRLRALLNGEHTYAGSTPVSRSRPAVQLGPLLFREGTRTGRTAGFSRRTEIDDAVLKKIIGVCTIRIALTYFPFCRPNPRPGLRAILGKVIRLTDGHQAKVEDKPEVKKAGGVYYTPNYIVDYIVKHTVGKLLEAESRSKRRNFASSTRLAAPAPFCSAHIVSARLAPRLVQRKRPEAMGNPKDSAIYQGPGGEWKLTTAERKRILLKHLWRGHRRPGR